MMNTTEETDAFVACSINWHSGPSLCLTVDGSKPSEICVLDEIQDLICIYTLNSTSSELLMILAVNLHCCKSIELY